MMDLEKFKQAVELLKDSGAKAVVLMTTDGTKQSAFIEGLGIDIVQCLYASMKKGDQFAVLAGMALSNYLDEKENEHNNKNNKQHGRQHKN